MDLQRGHRTRRRASACSKSGAVSDVPARLPQSRFPPMAPNVSAPPLPKCRQSRLDVTSPRGERVRWFDVTSAGENGVGGSALDRAGGVAAATPPIGLYEAYRVVDGGGP